MKPSLLLLALCPALHAKDWPMWGGTPARNMVSPMTGAPTEWDVKSGKNVKWVAELGSQSYDLFGRLDGKPTTLVIVYLQTGANAVMNGRTSIENDREMMLRVFSDRTGYSCCQ